jgi:hypothetical protein
VSDFSETEIEADDDDRAIVAERNLRIVEALLFGSSEPLAPADIAVYLDEGADAEKLLATLQERYAGRGVNLVRRGSKWAFRTAEDLGFLLRREETENRALSRAALETLGLDELKGAGLLSSRLPPSMQIPLPFDGPLREDEDPLDPGDLDHADEPGHLDEVDGDHGALDDEI